MELEVQDTKTIFLHRMLGTLITVWLYGATCLQVHQYYNNFCADKLLLKFSVAFIFTLETVHAALCSHYLYSAGGLVYVFHYGRAAVASFYIGVVIAWIVNLFFVHRIYILSEKSRWISLVVAILATIRPTFGFAVVVLAIIYPGITFGAHAGWILITSVSIELFVDGLIAIFISYFLLKGRKKGVASTRNIINTLLKYTLHTGVILMILASIELVEVVHWPYTSAITTAIFHIQVQLYANCFFTMLNARNEIRHRMENSSAVTFSNMSSRPVAEREV